MDRFGRQGQLITYALILLKADFQSLNCDPFRVIDCVPFLNDPLDVTGLPEWPSIKVAKQLPALALPRAAESPPDAASPAEIIG